MKIVFFGNSDFSVLSLQHLIKIFEVLAIVTAPDSVIGRGHKNNRLNPVKEIAIQDQIPLLQPAKLKNNNEFYQTLKDLQADLHVIVSYGKIIPKDMIDIPKYNTINLHASLLPALRGAAPIQYALWQGLEITGNTVQFISEGMDEGDIISQSIVPINHDDDYTILEQKLAKDGADLLVQSILKIKYHSVSTIKQNHDEATYTKLITKEDGAIFFSMSAEEINDAFRAFKKKPTIYAPLTLGNIKILDMELNTSPHTNKEGEIIAINSEGIVVSCYEGSITLKKLQAPNKKALIGKDFANGNRLKIGSILK